MKLVDTASVRIRLGFDSTAAVDTAIESALEAATAQLSSVMQTKFDRTVVTDVFYVRSADMVGTSFQKRFRLSQGLLLSSPALTCKSALLRSELATSTTNLRSYDGVDYVSVDLEKGLVRTDDWDFDHEYVQMTYTAGFAAEGNDKNLYEQSEVPSWLKELATAQASIVLYTNPLFHRPEDRTDDELKALRDAYEQLLQGHIRYFPSAERPLG